jgi:hypothetical protein
MADRFDLNVGLKSTSVQNSQDVCAVGFSAAGLSANGRLSYNLRLDPINFTTPLVIDTSGISVLKALYIESLRPISLSIPAAISFNFSGVFSTAASYTISLSRFNGTINVVNSLNFTGTDINPVTSLVNSSLNDFAVHYASFVNSIAGAPYIAKVSGNIVTVSSKSSNDFSATSVGTGTGVVIQNKTDNVNLSNCENFIYKSTAGSPIAKEIRIKSTSATVATNIQLIILGD